MKTKTLKGTSYWVLLCDNKRICGVYASKDEAKEANESIISFGVKHSIKKCDIKLMIKR